MVRRLRRPPATGHAAGGEARQRDADRLDLAREALRAKSELLTRISYAIRTPMSGVIGMAQLLLDTPLSSQQREYVQIVSASGEGVLRVIDDVLHFSHIDEARLVVTERPTGESTGPLDGAAGPLLAPLPGIVVADQRPAHDGLHGGRAAADAPRVLLVEDNAVNRHVARLMVQNLGYRVDVAADGQAAVDAVADVQYAVVLMDCQMPRLDGYAATATIRQRQGAGRRTPIVAMTALALYGDRERCLAAGMDDYLSKPVRAAELATTLERWLPQASTGRTPPLPGQSAPATRAPAVDRETLRGLRELEDDDTVDVMRDLHQVFREDATARLATMRAAAAADDRGALQQHAHALKGSAACLGATAMAGLCENLELVVAGADLAPAEGILQQLDEEFGRADAALAGYVAEATPVVLVVDDEPLYRRMMGTIMRRAGYRVAEAADGREALALVSRQTPDAIVVDLRMPVMNGVAFIERCRELPSLRRVPIVTISAADHPASTLDRLRAANVHHYLAKPLDTWELRAVVERLVGQAVAGSASRA